MRRIIENYLYGLGIKKKLMLFVVIVIAFLVLQSTYITKRDYNILIQYEEDNQNYSTISELKKTLEENNTYLNQYFDESLLNTTNLFNQSTLKILSDFNRTGYKIFELIQVMENSTQSLEEHLLIQAIRNSCDIYREEANKTIRERNNSITMNQNKVNKMYGYIYRYIDQLIEQSSNARNNRYDEIFSQWNRSKNITLIILFMIIIGIVLVGILFSEYLTNNIKQIINMQTQIATGNFKINSYPNQMRDEMGELNKSLNHMNKSIKEKMDKLNEKAIMERRLYQEELLNLEMRKSLHEARYAMLQSQINPHFLFNTLNIISIKTMFNDSESALKLIKALSELFRHSLLDVSDRISLNKELDLINEYLFIQKTRFGNRISFEINKEVNDLDQILIPPLILQPIVENAIIHGLEPKEEHGKLCIDIIGEKDKVLVRIQDDGVGMTQEKLMMLKSSISDDDNEKSIGIKNVKNRMDFLYGKEEYFYIESTLNKGTCIELRFPMS
jgi:sensor histidine kinase YesM